MRILCAAVLLIASVGGTNPAFAQGLPYGIDENSIHLSSPPAPGSGLEKQDYLTIKNWQTSRTQEQCVSADGQSFKKLPALFFAGGDVLPASLLPDYTPFLEKIVQLSMRITQPIQNRHRRLRPFQQYNDVIPCVGRPNTASYPSSHATTGMLIAYLLAEIVPAQKSGLLALGTQIGLNRVIGGVHFPSDVAAGQAVAEQLWKQIRIHPVFLQEARDLRAKTAYRFR